MADHVRRPVRVPVEPLALQLQQIVAEELALLVEEDLHEIGVLTDPVLRAGYGTWGCFPGTAGESRYQAVLGASITLLNQLDRRPAGRAGDHTEGSSQFCQGLAQVRLE